MKKKIAILGVALLLLTGCGKIPKLSNGNEAVVSFEKDGLSSNQLHISVDDLYTELKDKYAVSVLVNMIDKKIFEIEYKDQIQDAKDSADEQLTSSKSQFTTDGVFDEDSFISALQQYIGVSTIDEYWNLLYLNYFETLAIEDYAKSIVTDKEIKDYYKNEEVGDIACSHILITADVTDDMSSDEVSSAELVALNKAKDIIAELDKAKDVSSTFASLAKKYSKDTNNASKGGDLGYFNKGDMQETFETAAYALKMGAYTKTPVKTSYGYHIILKTGEKAKKSLSEVKEDIIKNIADDKVDTDKTIKVDALVNLRKKYGVKFEDSDLSSQYDKLIQYQIKSAESSDTES